MNIIRFIFPFLFVRNWYDGSWELSRARLILTAMVFFLIVLGMGIAYYLHIPVTYTANI